MKIVKFIINLFFSLSFISCLSIIFIAQSEPNIAVQTNDTKNNTLIKRSNINDLPLKSSITQYGITWTFKKPMPVGKFLNGDYYVVGKTIITAITPEPRDGRNGSCLNPSAIIEKAGFDSRIRMAVMILIYFSLHHSSQTGKTLYCLQSALDELRTVKPMLYAVKKQSALPYTYNCRFNLSGISGPIDTFDLLRWQKTPLSCTQSET
jgi:hypothetical protein